MEKTSKKININESLMVKDHNIKRKRRIKKCEKYTLLSYFEKTLPKTAQKLTFSIKDFFSKCDQVRNFLRFAVK